MPLAAWDSLRQDLRYTLRTLGRDAGFTTFALLIVALGIGASSTVFSVVNTLLVRPLPFREPDRLVWIANANVAGLSGQTTQVGYLLDLRERNRVSQRNKRRRLFGRHDSGQLRGGQRVAFSQRCLAKRVRGLRAENDASPSVCAADGWRFLGDVDHREAAVVAYV